MCVRANDKRVVLKDVKEELIALAIDTTPLYSISSLIPAPRARVRAYSYCILYEQTHTHTHSFASP